MKGFDPGEGTGLNKVATGVGKLFTKAKAKVKNYITDKKLEGFEKHRSEKLGKKYVPASKKSKPPFNKNGDFKKTKKKILSSTNIPTKEEPEGIPTEYTVADDYNTNVYRKGGKKYVAETDLEHEPTGKFQQITRKGKRQLKKEGSYVSGRQYKKIEEHYKSGKYAEDQHKKRRLKEVKSSTRDLKKERVKKIGNKKAQANLKSSIAGLKEKKKQLKNK